MSHLCPVKGCTTSVGDHKLLCAAHWKTVPFLAQRRLYAAWNDGAGKGTPEHREAMQAAIAAANAAQERTR